VLLVLKHFEKLIKFTDGAKNAFSVVINFTDEIKSCITCYNLLCP